LREDYEEPKLQLSNLVSVPLNKLDEYIENTDKRQKIILICQSGSRSFMAAHYLSKKDSLLFII